MTTNLPKVPRQLSLLEDCQGQSLQTRFEGFCMDAVDALTATQPDSGEPLLPAGKAKATLKITIDVSRLSDDSFAFDLVHSVKTALPQVPGKAVTSHLVKGVGLAQGIKDHQLSLLDPTRGQPKAADPDDPLPTED
jgi:hypothetical protein